MGDAAPAARTPFTIEYLLAARGSAGSPPPPSSTPTSPPGPAAQPGDKPAQSYIALISTAILSSPEKKLLLSDIYQWIMDKYPYFKNKVGGEGGWGGSLGSECRGGGGTDSPHVRWIRLTQTRAPVQGCAQVPAGGSVHSDPN